MCSVFASSFVNILRVIFVYGMDFLLIANQLSDIPINRNKTVLFTSCSVNSLHSYIWKLFVVILVDNHIRINKNHKRCNMYGFSYFNWGEMKLMKENLEVLNRPWPPYSLRWCKIIKNFLIHNNIIYSRRCFAFLVNICHDRWSVWTTYKIIQYKISWTTHLIPF